MILLLRASHANEFELQNYAPIAKKLDIRVITSLHPLTPVSLPTIPLWSPTDLPIFPYRRQILNRLIGGEQWLDGLNKLVESRIDDSNHRYKSIIHTAETYTPYTHQAVQLRKRGVIEKLICTCWDTIPHNNEKFSRLQQWKQEAYHYVDHFHTPTERAKQALIAEGVDHKRITVIPYGVDLSRFRPSPVVAKKAKSRPIILTVARLEKEKGMQDLELVAERLPDIDFLVVGQGSYSPRGSNITVRSVPYSQIHRLYQKADLFFLPSRTTTTWEEQYGMVLIEAMACSLPVIATRSGAIPEVVGTAGITLQECDVESATKSIIDLLAHPQKRLTMGKRARDYAISHYDHRKISRRLSRLYR